MRSDSLVELRRDMVDLDSQPPAEHRAGVAVPGDHGLRRLLVRGLAKARAVALIHAIAHSLWRAHRLRQAAA